MSIYIGPMTHSILYVDDVGSGGVALIKASDLPVLAIVETSPGSHQMWFPIPDGVSAWALSSALRDLVGGDAKAHESGAHLQPRIGRLPGFTNSKPARRMDNGLFPFVRLVHAARTRPSPEQLRRLAALTGPCPTAVASMQTSIAGNGTHAAGRAGAAARGKSDLRSDRNRGIEDRAFGRNENDWREVRRRLRAGAGFEQCVDYLRALRPDKSADYAGRTAARAAASLGMRDLVPDDPELQRFCDMYQRDRRSS